MPTVFNSGLLLLLWAASPFLVAAAAEGQTAAADTVPEPVAKCSMCHGEDGNSPTSNIPTIAGITPEYFRHVMDAYKNNGRPSEIMKMFVHSLDDKTIDQLAAYYNKQKFKPTGQKFDQEMAAKGKQLHLRYCEKCHENSGRISENNYGILAGQWMEYLRMAVHAYQEKKRRVNPMMLTKLKKLQEEAGKEGIEQVLNYYASLSQ